MGKAEQGGMVRDLKCEVDGRRMMGEMVGAQNDGGFTAASAIQME
jgi:hypothetical protein